MFKATWFSLKVAVLATAVVLTCAGDSWAQRRGGGGGGGRGWGGGGWGGGGRGWDGGGWGGRGWGYGGWGGYGYSPGWYGGYYDDGPYYSTMPYYSDTAYVPSSATSGYQSFYPPSAGYGQTNGNLATIQVRVPPNAKLVFNGKETSQTGPQRFFTTPPLEPGKTYTYEVDATWQDANGQQVKRHRDVHVQANQPVTVNFMDNQNQIQNSDPNQIRNPESNRNQNQDQNRIQNQKQKQIPDIR
jgi:uncharacterized protein (TIGR03000 family)